MAAGPVRAAVATSEAWIDVRRPVSYGLAETI